MEQRLQALMDAAFDNYFEMSIVLRDDLIALQDTQSTQQHWKRTFIRSSAALFEGYTHCLQEICAISFKCEAPKLSKKETAVLLNKGNFSAKDRIKYTLRAAYRLFELDPPEFGGVGWSRAQGIFRTRHLLMHPKTARDLAVDDQCWMETWDGVYWLLRQFVQFFDLLQRKIRA
jgi:hypothetical protein